MYFWCKWGPVGGTSRSKLTLIISCRLCCRWLDSEPWFAKTVGSESVGDMDHHSISYASQSRQLWSVKNKFTKYPPDRTADYLRLIVRYLLCVRSHCTFRDPVWLCNTIRKLETQDIPRADEISNGCPACCGSSGGHFFLARWDDREYKSWSLC